MSSLGELEQRIAAIEERLVVEAGLRASGDRDLASTNAHVRAQTHLVQALSITQAEHTAALRGLGEAVETVRQDHGAKLDRIIGMLGRLLDDDGDSPTAR